MLSFIKGYNHGIHRHIGGLENSNTESITMANIHRHIGGLESY